MKRWFRRVLLVAVPLALIVAGLYEAATHVGRGWLRGEAFYDGRPTSYWRNKIDDWMERFDSPEDAEWSIDHVSIDAESDPGSGLWLRISNYRSGPQHTPPPLPDLGRTTFVDNIFNNFRGEDARLMESLPPKVLWGWYDADSVLLTLGTEPKYQLVVERAFRNVELVKKKKNERVSISLSVSDRGAFFVFDTWPILK